MAKAVMFGPKTTNEIRDLLQRERGRGRDSRPRRGRDTYAVHPYLMPHLVKTDASHAKGASGTCSIYTGTPGSETDSGINITAFNKFADLASGKWAWAANNGSGWYLTAGEC